MRDGKLGIGIFGAGWVAGEHAKAYMNNPHCEIVAIGSRTEEGARAFAERLGIQNVRFYTDFQKFLDDPELDALSICTPPHLHAQETIEAAQAGKHILIEKPVALNLEDLRRMDNAVKEAGVKTVVSFVLRWNPLFQSIKALLEQGAIGKVFYAEVDYWHGIGPWYKQYKWNIKKEIGGSSLLSAGCHAVDAMRFFLGKEVAEVFAYSTKIWQDYEYDPTIAGVLRFTDGTIGKISSCLECTTPYQFNIDLLGEYGTIRNNKIYSKKLFPGQTDYAIIPTVLPDSGEVSHHPFQGEIDHFIDCILNDVESHVNLADAVKTHEIIFAMDLSAEEGRPVKLPLP
ncbi:gfo/Idh/MocA family oxidoreductase [Candidatus Poribacteria bacterium]|nr:MAG: gfo/Idh/MocA family oxidoreductase [Candidatus Poribacteria bacterium]